MAASQNNVIGEVALRVVPIDPASQFQAGVDKIIRQLEKNAQFQVRASGLEQVQQQANQAGQAFAQAAIEAAGLTAAIFGIKASVEGAINKLSGLFDQLAQARAGFTSILHSEAAGGQLLADIREFARVSPFVTQELVNYSQQLLGVGLSAQKIIPLLKSTGDIISSVGGDTSNLGRVLFTLTQIKSIGSLKGQDTLQLQNSLIPITKYLSEYLHKSASEIVKLRENAQITADDVFNALNAQGEKVKGAMDRATRNIAGARAILSDTITQLFQNQPVLNKIFTDVYKGIQAFANKLSEDTFQQAFAQFFDGINKLYEGIKPLLEGISKAAGGGAISAMQVFGTTLGLLGTALKAIPQFAIEAIARLFVALGTLKAPLLLLKYVTTIKTMATAILPATAGLAKLGTAAEVSAQQINVETAAIERNTAATRANTSLGGAGAAVASGGNRLTNSRFGQFVSGHKEGAILAGSLAASVAGGYLSQQDSSTAKTVGGALQGGAIGAQLGLLAGPEGAVIGAALGAAVGGITSFLSQAEAKAKKHIEAMKKLGTEAATEYIAAEGKRFGTGVSGTAFTEREAEIKRLTRIVTDAQIALADKHGEAADITGFTRGNTLTGKNRATTTDTLTQAKAELESLTGSTAAAFDPITFGLQSLTAGLDSAEKGFIGLTNVSRGGVRIPTGDLAKAEATLKGYGIALGDVADPDKLESMIQLIKTFDGLTTAQQKATTEATKFNTALDDAKKLASAIFDPQEKKLQGQLDSIKGIADAEAAQYDFSTKNSDISAKLAAIKGQEAKHAEALAYYLGLGYAQSTATYRANIDGETEYQRLLKLRISAQNNRGAINRLAAVNANDPGNLGIGPGRDINKEIADQEKAAKDAADKAKKDAEDAAKKAQQWADTMRNATEALASKLESAANDIASAADRWVGSIKDRTQYEQSVSVGTATRNARKQVNDLTEISAGITQLRARGLSQQAIDSLGINNVSDLKQVRKLLRGSPGDLTKLSSTVADLNKTSTDLATREEDTRTRKNIAAGVYEAGKALGLDTFTKTDAAALGANFTITTVSNADDIAAAIIAALSARSVNR